MTQPISANPAAVLAAQNEAAAQARETRENRRPPVEAAKESHNSSRYAERRAQAEDRGKRVDVDA